MTIQEIMERSGVRETSLAIAWIKDAIHLIQSNSDDAVTTWKATITDTIREYPFPANLIKLKSLSVLDTTDDKYKRIRRLTHEPTVSEDTDPD